MSYVIRLPGIRPMFWQVKGERWVEARELATHLARWSDAEDILATTRCDEALVEPGSTRSPRHAPVRIAVAVDEKGRTHSCGATDYERQRTTELSERDQAASLIALANVPAGIKHVVFVTANVPLPSKPAEVEGLVEPTEEDQ